MKILHIDNQAIFRAGIKCILNQFHPTIEFLEASDLKTALAIVSTHQDMDLLLVDLTLSNQHELDDLKELCSYVPTTPTVVITALHSPSSVQIAQEVGIAGYIPKSATSTTLIRALQIVLEGGRYTPRIARLHHCSGKGLSPSLSQQLTKRQSEVMALVAEGMSNKAIARKLGVSEATVKGHVTAILIALGVSNRVQAINRWQDVKDDLKLAS